MPSGAHIWNRKYPAPADGVAVLAAYGGMDVNLPAEQGGQTQVPAARELGRLLKAQPVPISARAMLPRPLARPPGHDEAPPAAAAAGPDPAARQETMGDDPALSAASSVASAVARSLMEAQVELAVQVQAGLTRLLTLLGEAEQLTRQLQQQLAPRMSADATTPPARTTPPPA